jgi:hypothetical protein
MNAEGFGNSVPEQVLHQIHLQPRTNNRRKSMSAEQELKWFIAAVLGSLLVMVIVAIVI